VPTQPFARPPPFARQKFFTSGRSSPFLSPPDRARFRDEILSARTKGLFNAAGQRNTVQCRVTTAAPTGAAPQWDPPMSRFRGVSKDLLPCPLAKDADADKALGGFRQVSATTPDFFFNDRERLLFRSLAWSSLTAYDLNR